MLHETPTRQRPPVETGAVRNTVGKQCSTAIICQSCRIRPLGDGEEEICGPCARLREADAAEPTLWLSASLPISAFKGHPLTWAPVDIRPYLDGSYRPEPPGFLHRDDGCGMFYPGDVNWVWGDSGAGKTMLVLLAVKATIERGEHVVWIHYEDPRVNKIVSRLVQLGADPAHVLERFHAIEPRGEDMTMGVGWVLDVIEENDAVLCVVDSIGEAMNASTVDENSDAEVGPWLTQCARSVADAGITFIGIDHTTIGDPERLHPSGSKRKRAAITGAGWSIQSVTPFTRTEAGMSRIVVGKDREGNYRRGDTFAMFHLDPDPLDPDRSQTRLATPVAVEQGTATVILAARNAVATLKAHGEATTQNQLAALMTIKCRKDAKVDGIKYAVDAGCISTTPGPRGSQFHEYVTDDGLQPH